MIIISILQMITYKSADEVIDGTLPSVANIILEESEGKKIDLKAINPEQKQALDSIDKMNVFLDSAQRNFSGMFNEAYKYADEENDSDSKAVLKDLANLWQKELGEFSERVKKDSDKPVSLRTEQIQVMSDLLDQSVSTFDKINPPRVIVPVEEFALDKSAETFANVALHSYNEYGKKAPIIGIENLYPGFAFSKPEDFKELIDKSRETFIKKAVSDGMSRSEAKSAANQVIGVTWDVGHLNMLRKQGFKEKDLLEASKLIGKDVKHVHLTDNFGFKDSHLAPGMGNVPIKKHLEILEKAGALEEGRVINEIGGFINQFKTSPLPYMLEAFGAPTGSQAIPYWNQAVWNQGNYSVGYGDINPQIHHSIWGRSFAGLPAELGGQAPGANASRATGTPLA